jgi:hypothetical protein
MFQYHVSTSATSHKKFENEIIKRPSDLDDEADQEEASDTQRISKNGRASQQLAQKKLNENSFRSDDEDESKLCIRCVRKPRQVVFFPCSHLCACRRCAREIWDFEEKLCPLCKNPFNNTKSIAP